MANFLPAGLVAAATFDATVAILARGKAVTSLL